jgi:hypothetical protein
LLLGSIASQLDFFREQQTQLRETSKLSLYTLLHEHAASELALLGPRFCNKTTRARSNGTSNPLVTPRREGQEDVDLHNLIGSSHPVLVVKFQLTHYENKRTKRNENE